MALSLPNVCVYPDAQVKFHLAYNANTRETDYGVSAHLFSYYPEAVQERLGRLTRQYHIMSGLELISLGVRNCNGPDRILVASKRPPKAPVPGSDGFGDIAHSVRAAVASAFEGNKEPSNAPIRIAVIDRKPVPPTMPPWINDARLATASTAPPMRDGFTYAAPSITSSNDGADIPLPPRRPPSTAFDAQDARPEAAFSRLIPGAQPIIENTQFTLKVVARGSAMNERAN
jgi:hypothetical protein